LHNFVSELSAAVEGAQQYERFITPSVNGNQETKHQLKRTIPNSFITRLKENRSPYIKELTCLVGWDGEK